MNNDNVQKGVSLVYSQTEVRFYVNDKGCGIG